MLERCDPSTVTVFDAALAEARRLGHNYVGTEHLLVALVRRRDLLPATVAALLPAEDAVRAVLQGRLAGPPSDEAGVLATIGIDLDAVRAAVRHSFGSDAIERLAYRRVYQPWQPWRRPHRRCLSLLAGSMGVAPQLKQSFEHAAAAADRRDRAMIDPAGLLLGMVEVEDAMSTRVLRELGVDPGQIRQALSDTA